MKVHLVEQGWEQSLPKEDAYWLQELIKYGIVSLYQIVDGRIVFTLNNPLYLNFSNPDGSINLMGVPFTYRGQEEWALPFSPNHVNIVKASSKQLESKG